MSITAASDASCRSPAGHCITCSDEAVAMGVVRAGDTTALCRDEAGDVHEVAVDLVGPVAVGDGVLVHAGVAISSLEVPA